MEEPTRKNSILDVFLTNNDQLTRQIISTETSMSNHNIIQIETNIKIVEEKQHHQIKKSALSYRDLNFFNKDISWASIDADLLNTSWDMLLTDVKSDQIYKIIINILPGNLQKNMFCQRKVKKTPNTPTKKDFDEKKIKIAEENTEVNKSSNIRKCTKSDQKNWKQLKKFNKNRVNLEETRAIAVIKKKPKYFNKFVKNNSKIRAGIGPLQDEEVELGTKQQKNKRTTE